MLFLYVHPPSFSFVVSQGTERGVQVHGHVAVLGVGGEGGGEERPVRRYGDPRRQSGECTGPVYD